MGKAHKARFAHPSRLFNVYLPIWQYKFNGIFLYRILLYIPYLPKNALTCFWHSSMIF